MPDYYTDALGLNVKQTKINNQTYISLVHIIYSPSLNAGLGRCLPCPPLPPVLSTRKNFAAKVNENETAFM